MSIGLIGVIVSVVATVASITAGVVIARRYRDRRKLSIKTQPTPTLLTVDKAIRERTEIRYEGREVEDLAGVTVTLRSTGNKAVRLPKDDMDYEEPVTIYFGEGTEIIGTPRITETEPDGLDASLEIIDSATIKLNPILLNPGNSISIFTLLTNLQEAVKVNGQIEDTTLLKTIESAELFPSPDAPTNLKAILAAAVPVIAAMSSWIVTGTLSTPEVALSVNGLVTGVVVALVPNSEAGIGAANKFIVAATTPIVSVLVQYAVSGAFDQSQLATMVVGLLTSYLVFVTPETRTGETV